MPNDRIDMKRKDWLLVALIILAAGITIGAFAHREITAQSSRDKEIRENVSEYFLNPKTGQIEFRRKPAPTPTPTPTATPIPPPTATPSPSITPDPRLDWNPTNL